MIFSHTYIHIMPFVTGEIMRKITLNAMKLPLNQGLNLSMHRYSTKADLLWKSYIPHACHVMVNFWLGCCLADLLIDTISSTIILIEDPY